jgi:hypothetical protein
MATAQEQLQVFQQRKRNTYNGTITVAAIYGSIAILLFLIILISPTGKSILTDSYLAFTVTFIGGMLFVTGMLALAIYTSKDPKLVFPKYDNMICPDYWRLVKTPEDVLKDYKGEDKFRYEYMCVNNEIPSITHPSWNDAKYKFIDQTARPTDVDKEKLLEIASNMNSKLPGLTGMTQYTESVTASPAVAADPSKNIIAKPATAAADARGSVYCGALFPDYFNTEDSAYNEEDSNKLRCNYSKMCGIPWTTVCPERN